MGTEGFLEVSLFGGLYGVAIAHFQVFISLDKSQLRISIGNRLKPT